VTQACDESSPLRTTARHLSDSEIKLLLADALKK
jgi:hypothetical protein